MFGGLFKERCDECDQPIVANGPELMGFVRAVHIHDEHPEKFEELAADARNMLEHTDEVVDDAQPFDVDSMGGIMSLLGGGK